MRFQIALIFATLIAPIAFQTPAISQPSSAVSIATRPTPVPPPDRARAADLARKDAIENWNFPSSGRVTKIEAITSRSLDGVIWISATVPTWRITLEGEGQRFVYITNDRGGLQILARRENLNLSNTVPRSVITAVQQSIATANNANYKNTPNALQPNQVLIQSATAQQWSDGCLGIPTPNETCPRATTPGWRITAQGKKGKSFTVRTDRTGKQVRPELPGQVNNPVSLDDHLAKIVKRKAGSHFKLLPDRVRIVKVEENQWDGCLGLGGPAEGCMAGPIRGYRVTVEGKPGQTKVYRINVMSTIRPE